MKLIKTTDHGVMKFKTLDAVSGNTLAEMLEVKHDKMMRTIKRVMKSEDKRKKITPQVGVSHTPQMGSEIVHIVEENELNFNAVFKEYQYTDSMNRSRNTFIMNEDALYLVIANTQSVKAHELKVLFKSEFNKMKDEREVREIAKSDSLKYTDSIQYLYKRLVEVGTTQKEDWLYTTIQRKLHKKATGNTLKLGGVDHDALSDHEEAVIAILRQLVPGWIKEGDILNPREARKHLYRCIESFNLVSIERAS